MRIVRALALPAAVMIAVTGCSGFAPYPTFPASAALGETDAGPRVAICFNSLVSTLDQVHTAAQQECAANTQATPVRTDSYLQYCPLLQPIRATFLCAPKK